MRLKDLGAKFIQYKKEPVDPTKFIDGIQSPSGFRVSLVSTDNIKDAHGIMFKCPLCASKKDKGVHQVICWFVGKVADDVSPGPGRWTPQGTGIDDLTFVTGNPPRAISVLLTGDGCGWHGYVKNGDAT